MRSVRPRIEAPTPGDRTLYTYAEAAAILRRSEVTVRRWVRDGRIPPYLITSMGKRTHFLTGDQLVRVIDLFADGLPPAAPRPRARKVA